MTPWVADAQMPGARRAVQRASTAGHGASSSSSARSAVQSANRSSRPSGARQPSRGIRSRRGGAGRRPFRYVSSHGITASARPSAASASTAIGAWLVSPFWRSGPYAARNARAGSIIE